MPSWLTKALELLGLTTPFIYAAATYGLFHFLDKRASGQAKQALRRQIETPVPLKEAVANFTVEAFDRLYTRPLLHWRGFVRSFAVTIVVTVVVLYELGHEFLDNIQSEYRVSLYSNFVVFNALADYVSLFFIRMWLIASSTRPIIGLLVSLLVGATIIFASFFVRQIFFALYMVDFDLTLIGHAIRQAWQEVSNPVGDAIRFRLELLATAIAVHLWFPLFALAVLASKALAWFFKAVGWMQWFLKHGQHHPFQSVGYVAAVIVFVGTATVQWIWR